MENIQEISAEDLKKKMEQDDDLVVINVLSEESFNDGHIPGSINIPGSTDDFVDRVEDALGGDRSREVIVYCASFDCQASPSAARALMEAGFENVLDYAGGMKDWVGKGFEVASGE